MHRAFDSKGLACALGIAGRTHSYPRTKNGQEKSHLDGDLPDALSGVRVAHDPSAATQLRDLFDGLKRSHLTNRNAEA